MSKKAKHIVPAIIDFDENNYREKVNTIVSESTLRLAQIHCAIEPSQREEFLESIVDHIKLISLEIETHLPNSTFLA